MLQPATLSFLKQLKKHNDKTWFDAHRAQFEAARDDFASFIEELIARHGVRDEGIRELKAKDCIFRIYRDVRFSKDKSPYKTNFGAAFQKGGKKSPLAGYYFHLSADGDSFAGGGLWMPLPDDLKKVRQEIDYCWDEFRGIVGSKGFKAHFGDLQRGEYSLSTMPKGYEKENPAAGYLKLKCFVAVKAFSEEDLFGPGLVKRTLKTFETLQPLLAFINRAIEASPPYTT